MTLPPRIPKKAKRSSRWRSQKHCGFIRSHACSVCHDTAGIEVAHVRNGSGAGMGQKPDDFHAVSLCKQCHQRQHSIGETTFWKGQNIAALIDAFCRTSPMKREIAQIKKERGGD
jgi:5-methylcytosine-specific restriction endonuclease McrA